MKRIIGMLKRRLDKAYPEVKCTLNYSNPLEMLIATQLSAQCTDARVNVVTKELFKRYKTCEDYANAELSEVEGIIHSLGFYRNKARNIIACCQKLLSDYNGEVPDTMEELLTLPGTGRKTANLVLGDIFGKPAVVVDTHCIRITNRLGLVEGKDPEKIEMELWKLLPPEYSLTFCHQMVNHGRARCRAINPDCENCELADVCQKVGVDKVECKRPYNPRYSKGTKVHNPKIKARIEERNRSKKSRLTKLRDDGMIY